MPDPVQLLVLCATQPQGSAVAQHALADHRYRVRCIVDDIRSDASQALRDRGAELVEGAVEYDGELTRAMQGCHFIFAVTDENMGAEQSFRQGRQIVDAIRRNQIHHTVFSTLPHAALLSAGQTTVPRLDAQAQIEEYARSQGVPATYIHVALTFESFLNHLRPSVEDRDQYTFALPQGSTPLAAVAAEDVGGVVSAIFAESFWYRDKTVGVVGDERRCEEYAELMSMALNKRVNYQFVSHDEFAAQLRADGTREATGIADLFEFNRRYVLTRGADLAKSRELYPEIRTFDRWLKSRVNGLRTSLAH